MCHTTLAHTVRIFYRVGEEARHGGRELEQVERVCVRESQQRLFWIILDVHLWLFVGSFAYVKDCVCGRVGDLQT